MGLDMYLTAKKHISNFDFYDKEKEVNMQVKKVLGLEHLDGDDAGIEVAITVAYWRKANQVHAWFVENCQDGKDECQETYIERHQLEELRDLCNKAVDEQDANLLPPRSGFFFGSTEVDEFYWSDIEHTRKVLNDILSDETLKDYDFYYRSSW